MGWVSWRVFSRNSAEWPNMPEESKPAIIGDIPSFWRARDGGVLVPEGTRESGQGASGGEDAEEKQETPAVVQARLVCPDGADCVVWSCGAMN